MVLFILVWDFRSYVPGMHAVFGIPGRSRYAKRLRSQLREAATSPTAADEIVVLKGEAGLQKDYMCNSIHFQSPGRRNTPCVHVDMQSTRTEGSELQHAMELVANSGGGTLVVDNADAARAEHGMMITSWLRTQQAKQPGRVRLMCTSRSQADPPWLTAAGSDTNMELRSIKVPPLRVRKSDIVPTARYLLRVMFLNTDQKTPKLSPNAEQLLEDYNFPQNTRELDVLISRAVAQARQTIPNDGKNEAMTITPDMLWTTQWNATLNRQRFNLFEIVPQLFKLARSDWYPQKLNDYVVVPFFFAFNALLIYGPQTRDTNPALNIFWDYWWTIFLILTLPLGRIWCGSICPFSATGSLAQRAKRALGFAEKEWPVKFGEKVDGWAQAVGFAAIVLWEDVYHLNNSGVLSSALLLLITSGATIGSLLYEKRFWCRYLCPVGGMFGLFSKLASTELRAQRGVCSAECTNDRTNPYACYVGA